MESLDNIDYKINKNKYRSIIINKGDYGWGGPLTIVPTETKNKILVVTGGGFSPLAQHIANMTGCELVDGFKTTIPDEEVILVIVDCSGTARCGVYPKKGIFTVNLTPVGKSGPLAKFITEDVYVSGVKEDNILFFDEYIEENKNSLDNQQKNFKTIQKFDYNKLIKNYDIKSIDVSVIKYYKAVISWVNILTKELNNYQNQKNNVISEFNKIVSIMSKDYEYTSNFTDEEIFTLRDRQKFLKSNLELGIFEATRKILSYKEQAQDIKDRIEEINNCGNGIKELAILQNENRVSFELLAENTANIVIEVMEKIENFEKNKDYINFLAEQFDKWTSDYIIFKTAYKESFKNNCEDNGIEEDIYKNWFIEWNKTRYVIENQFLPLVKQSLYGNFVLEKSGTSIIKEIINLLDKYKKKIDKFYMEERKDIYVKYIFATNGELQQKIETESELYKISSEFETELYNLIFTLEYNENKIFLVNWSSNLLDLPVNEIIDCIECKQLDTIPCEVLDNFRQLRKRNFEIYLFDAKMYSKEQERRNKQFNSLVFKMRKDLIK